MRRKQMRANGLRASIAAAAARIMAEDGIDDFALAKRKAARALGATEREALPANDEVESALREYRSIYQPLEHPARLASLRAAALGAMRDLRQFNPYLTGPVLTGTAGPHAEIEIQLFPDSAKEVELYLLERRLAFESEPGRRYCGERALAADMVSVDWHGLPVRLAVFDRRDERVALKSTVAGRVMPRAGIPELESMLAKDANLHA